MEGEVVYLFVYDAGAKFTEEQLKGLLKDPEDFSKYEYKKPTPEEIVSISIPFIFNLKEETLEVKKESLKFKVQCAIYPTGSYSIRVRHIFSQADADFLKRLAFDSSIWEFVLKAQQKAKVKVEASLSKIGPITPSGQNELYNFYYIEGEKDDVVKKNQDLITGMLIDEPNPDALEASYAADVMKRKLSYTTSEVTYVGWESAVRIDKSKSYEYEVLLAEIANVQLLELRISHDSISKKIASTDVMMTQLFNPRRFSRGVDLRKINLMLGELYDSTKDTLTAVNDTIYGFGDWYLVKLYGQFNDVFQLDEWRAYLDSDLQTVEQRRVFVSEIISSNGEHFLSLIVVLLILIEVFLEILYLIKM
jgi:hypothetical protein